MEQEGGDRAYAFRINLLPDDFEVGEKAVLEYTISFAEMPERFPGQIEPSRQPLAINTVTPETARVPQYDRLELRVELGATYDNPFDPDDVRLDAVFTAPSGRQLVVPGFFIVEHRREVAERTEVMIPQHASGWRVRFTSTGDRPLSLATATPRPQRRDHRRGRLGGVRRGQAARLRSHEQGRPALPGLRQRRRLLRHRPQPADLPHDRTARRRGDAEVRRGRRELQPLVDEFQRVWNRVDRPARLVPAGRRGTDRPVAGPRGRVGPVLHDVHGHAPGLPRRGLGTQPVQRPKRRAVPDAARLVHRRDGEALLQKRLRYTVARWGYSPNVLCWEFGNEMEGWADAPDEVKFPWHKEMSDYLRSIDPFGHLITTSFWSKTGPEQYWGLENIDIVQTHCYTNDDDNVAEAVRRYCLHQWERFPKPHIFGEFGIRSHASTADKDPQGWAIHNSLWAGLTSFAAGGPMPWWHENYIDPLDLYFHFTSLSRFTQDLPLGSVRWDDAGNHAAGVRRREPAAGDPRRRDRDGRAAGESRSTTSS